jgi:hypothetical protein
VKKLSNKNVDGDDERSGEFKKVCLYFGQFVKNICRHPAYMEKLLIKDLDGVALFRHNDKLSHDTLKDFILDVVPPLIEELTYNCKDKSPLKYAIMLRAAELQAQKLSSQGRSL